MRPIDADALKEQLESFVVGGAKEIEETTCGNEWIDGIHTAYREIGNMPTIEMNGSWIPVEERLPEECENVLAWIERDAWKDGSDYPVRTQEAAIGWHIKGRWHFDGYAGSTTECLAWMPLPEPYEVKKNDV